MNIWLPIITNLIILGIITAGFFIGRKNGFIKELTKFFILIPAVIGCYFLTPVITGLFLKIQAINELVASTTFGLQALKSLVFLIVFLIFYGLVTLIVNLIYRKKSQVNSVKQVKRKGLSRRETRRLRREDRKYNKALNKQSKGSRVGGIICAMLIALMISLGVMLPFKYVTATIAEIKNIPEINSAYEYTVFGQFDKVIDISDFIIKGE